MTRAVCGFYFSENREEILLIRKKRPKWQENHWNGVGGKVEEGEFALDAMRREFEEEAGIRVESWDPYFILSDGVNGFEVTYYRAFGGQLPECYTVTDEPVSVWKVSELFKLQMIPNLVWLIPMALDPNLSFGRGTWKDT